MGNQAVDSEADGGADGPGSPTCDVSTEVTSAEGMSRSQMQTSSFQVSAERAPETRLLALDLAAAAGRKAYQEERKERTVALSSR